MSRTARSEPRLRACLGAGGAASRLGCALVSGTKDLIAPSCGAGISFRRGSACNLPSPSTGGACSSSIERRAAVLAMARRPLQLRRVAGGDEVRLHLRQGAGERLAIGFAHTGERLGAREVAELLHGDDELVRGGLQKKLPTPAVGRMIAALAQRGGLEPVDHTGERDRLDIEDVGERALLDALVAGEVGEHLPLRAGEPEVARILLEPLAQEPGDVVQQESKGDGKAGHGSSRSTPPGGEAEAPFGPLSQQRLTPEASPAL